MTKLHKHLLTIAAAGLVSAFGAMAVSAEDIVAQPEAATEAPAVVPAPPTTPDATGEAAAVAPEANDSTATEVAPSSGTGTAEEPSFSVMPSEGPGGGCRGHKVEEPSV